MKEIFFMPLGGGQKVGASCYFLKLGESNILLDAGIGTDQGLNFEPDLYSLQTSPFLESLGQINQIFISHAHWDHVGYLPQILRMNRQAPVYMTETTAMLSEYQLYDRMYITGDGQRKNEMERLAVKSMMERIVKVSYLQTMDFGNYKVTFLPAGHIPGAMMMLFEYKGRKILYTGDYSIAGTALTDGCIIPDDMGVDTMILCGLHAKHPDYVRKSDSLYKTIGYVYRLVEKKKSVMCHVPQLSKGVEFLRTLDMVNYKHIPIYVDASVMPVLEKLERLSIPILNEDIHVAAGRRPDEPHIYITSQNRCCGFGCYESVHVDFSLHEDFGELKEFIKRVNPKQAFLVHCADAWHYAKSSESTRTEKSPESGADRNIGTRYRLRFPNALTPTLESELMYDADCKTQITYANNGEIYKV